MGNEKGQERDEYEVEEGVCPLGFWSLGAWDLTAFHFFWVSVMSRGWMLAGATLYGQVFKNWEPYARRRGC